MDFNFDDLKKEFDAIRSVRDIKEDSCDIGCDSDEESGGLIETVQKYMLSPANCGIYFSRLDIKVIGLRFGEDVQIRERKRMLRDILRAVTSKEELERLFEIINDASDEKIEVYVQLSDLFPSSKEIFDEKIDKNRKFRDVLRNILKEFEGVED